MNASRDDDPSGRNHPGGGQSADFGGHRTYVRRRGRMTRGQARALEELAQRYCLDPRQPGGASEVFGRHAPLGLEVGFGMGHALIDWAAQRPHWNLLGAEVYQPGIGSALLGLAARGLDNVRVLEAPAEFVLESWLAPASLAEVRVFFPDPWPKLRHHKRRLVQPAFAALVAARLVPGGLFWVATDWEPYARWIGEVLDAEPALEREPDPAADQAGDSRPVTRFEARGRRLGHDVWDLRYVRKR